MTSEDQKILFEKLGKQMNYTLGLPNFKLINDVIYKLCTKCKKYKPMTSKFFPRRNNVKCGYGSHCKECEKEKESKRIRIPSFNEMENYIVMFVKLIKMFQNFIKERNIFADKDILENAKIVKKKGRKLKELLRKLTIEIDFYHDCYLDVKLEL